MRRALAVVVLAGCAKGGGSGGLEDAALGVDASPVDATNEIADAAIDARPPDAHTPDAFVPDAFVPDAFVPDAFVPDAMPDAAVPDASPDAPPPDAMVDAMPDACVPVATERLVNPALDLAPAGTGWTQQPIQGLPGGPFPIITADGPTPHSAPYKAWLGGAAGSDADPPQASLTDQMYQDVVIPAGSTQVTVTGFYIVGTNESAMETIAYDTFRLDVIQPNGTPIENVLTLSNLTPVATFTAFSKTLTTNVAGQTIRLRATSTNDDTFHTNFFLDTLSLKATYCP